MLNKIVTPACLMLITVLFASRPSFAYQVGAVNELNEFGYTQGSFLGEHRNKRFY